MIRAILVNFNPCLSVLLIDVKVYFVKYFLSPLDLVPPSQNLKLCDIIDNHVINYFKNNV